MDDGGTHSEWRATTVFDKTTKDREVAKRERDTTAAGASILSIVAKEMHIKGNCETDGLMRIEGKVSGNVIAQGVELLASGSVDGDVIASETAKSTQTFVISGLVGGAVHAALVEVRKGGKVNGGVVADEAVIHGQVHGGVIARTRLALEETAEVEGDVHALRLGLKEGGQVNGNIHMGDRADLAPAGQNRTPSEDSLEAENEPLVSAAHGT